MAGCVHQDEGVSASLRWRGSRRAGRAGDALAGDAEPPLLPAFRRGGQVAGVDERASAAGAPAVL